MWFKNRRPWLEFEKLLSTEYKPTKVWRRKLEKPPRVYERIPYIYIRTTLVHITALDL